MTRPLTKERRVPRGHRGGCVWVPVLFVIGILLCPATGAAAADGNSVGGTGHIVPRGGIVGVSGVPGFEIDKIFVHVGQIVKKGDPLFEEDCLQAREDMKLRSLELKTFEVDSAYRRQIQAVTVKLAETRLQDAKRDLANYRAVGANGVTVTRLSQLRQAVEEAEANRQIQQISAQQLESDYNTQKLSESERVQASQANLQRCTPRAPSDGTILEIDRHVGEYAPGTPVLRFGDLSTMFVDAQFYQGDMAKIHVGMAVQIKNAAFPHLATGKVTNVGALIGTESQLGDVKIRLDRRDPADHVVGMEVEVVIPR
jgi:HlyD family secretion protein